MEMVGRTATESTEMTGSVARKRLRLLEAIRAVQSHRRSQINQFHVVEEGDTDPYIVDCGSHLHLSI